MSDVELLPIAARPRYVRRLVAVWRKQHLAMGDDLSVIVWTGEWPTGTPPFVAGTVPVREDDRIGGPGSVMVLGRVGQVWRVAYNMAFDIDGLVGVDELAITTAYLEVADADEPMKMWLHPSPTTGEVPMWLIPRGARK